MTLTVRSAAVNGATNKGTPLTHAEMDANWAHLANNQHQYLGEATGTANALILTPSQAQSAFVTGQKVIFKASQTNTGATTIAISGLSAVAIQVNGSACSGGEIVADNWYELWYDGTAFQLKNSSTFAQSGSVTPESVQTQLRRFVHVDSYAAGDGTTNDKTAIASALAALSPGGHIYFDPAKTYYVETDGGPGIDINKPCTVHFNGARIKHNSNSSTQNNAIEVRSTLGQAETWTETISAGTSTLTIVTDLAVGDVILVELGEGPDDPLIAHWYSICRVLSNSGSAITIDNVIPFDINDTGHVLYPITSLAENVRLLGVNVDQVGSHGTAPDLAVAITMARNVFIDTYSCYDVGTALSVRRGSENVKVGVMSGNVKQHGAVTTHGRAFTTWGSRNIEIGEQRIHSTHDAAFNFFEGFSHNIHFGLIVASFNTSTVANNVVFRMTGHSRATCDRVYVSSVNGIRLWLGTQSSELELGEVYIQTPIVKAAFLRNVKKLHYNGTTYHEPRVVHKTIILHGTVAAQNFTLCSGYVKKLSVYVDSTTDITSAFLRNSNGDLSASWVGTLVAGSWVDIPNIDQFNSDNTSAIGHLDYPDKEVRFTTGATCNTVMKIRVEYFPNGEDGGGSAEFPQGASIGIGNVTNPSSTSLLPVTIASRNTASVGNVTTGEDNLQTYTMPANTLSANGKGVRITAWGLIANNANAKTLKLYFGATAISTQTLTVSQAGVWEFTAIVYRTSTDNQKYKATFQQEGATEIHDVDRGVLTEDDGAAIVIKCTGEAVASNDIAQEGMLVEFLG